MKQNDRANSGFNTKLGKPHKSDVNAEGLKDCKTVGKESIQENTGGGPQKSELINK